MPYLLCTNLIQCCTHGKPLSPTLDKIITSLKEECKCSLEIFMDLGFPKKKIKPLCNTSSLHKKKYKRKNAIGLCLES